VNVSGMLERVASMCPCRVHRLRGPTESTESVDSKEREAKKDGKEQKGPRNGPVVHERAGGGYRLRCR